MELGNIVEPVKPSGSQIENVINHTKNPEMFEMMLKVKEEPMSDDENGEVDTIGNTTHCLEDSMEGMVEMDSENSMNLSSNIKTEDIRLYEEEGKETNHFIQKIKLESTNCSQEENSINMTAGSIEENLKVEELVVAWTEDQYESSCSSEQPDFRDEMCSLPEFKHFLEESEIKYDVQNSLKRKINETLEESCLYEERTLDIVSDEDNVINVDVEESSEPKLKRIRPHKKTVPDCMNAEVTEYMIERSEADAAAKVCVPPGWKRNVVERKTGNTAGMRDVYYYSPDGKKLRSSKEVEKYCLEHGLNEDLSFFTRYTFSRGIFMASKSSKSCNTSKTTEPSKTSKLLKTPKSSKPQKKNKNISDIITAEDIIKIKEEINGNIAENYEDMEDGLFPVTSKSKRWSNELKLFAVKRYLETRNYEETIADFISKFSITTKPPSKETVLNWIVDMKPREVIVGKNGKSGNETRLEEDENIIIKDTEDWSLAKSLLRNIRIDKQHEYYGRKKIRIMHQPPLVVKEALHRQNARKAKIKDLKDLRKTRTIDSITNELKEAPPQSENLGLLTIMKNVFNDKDNGDGDNGDDNLHQDTNNGEAIDKYFRMWKVLYPRTDIQEQKDMYEETRGNIRETMDKLRKLDEERNKKFCFQETIKIGMCHSKKSVDIQSSLKKNGTDATEVKEIEIRDDAPVKATMEEAIKAETIEEVAEKETVIAKEATMPNGDASTEHAVVEIVVKAGQKIKKSKNKDIKRMRRLRREMLDSDKFEKFIQTSSVLYPELTKEEIRKIYEESKGSGEAINHMKFLNKERKSMINRSTMNPILNPSQDSKDPCNNGYLRECTINNDSLNKQKLEESMQDIEKINSDCNDNSDETNDGPLQNGKIVKYIKMWKLLYPTVNVQIQRKVYLENKGDVKKTMVELKKLNEKTETDRIKDPCVWSLADDETFRAGVCCPFCGRYFNYKDSFLKHYNTHREEKPFSCQYCEYRSKTEDNVKIHIRRNHELDPLFLYKSEKKARQFVCPYCPYNHFKTKANLERHIVQIHQKYSYFYKDAEERPFACAYCLYRSKQKGNLKTHVFARHPDKPWPVSKIKK